MRSLIVADPPNVGPSAAVGRPIIRLSRVTVSREVCEGISMDGVGRKLITEAWLNKRAMKVRCMTSHFVCREYLSISASRFMTLLLVVGGNAISDESILI